MPSPAAHYHAVAKTLHWLTALAIIALLAIGWTMTDMDNGPDKFMFFQLHKSLGITVLLLSVARLAWRLTHPAPPLPSHMATWEKRVARATHILFYVLIIVMPMTGWALVSASRHAIPTLLYGVVPWPALPGFATLPNKGAIGETIGDTHSFLAAVLAGLLVLHVGAALKHHIIDRDDVLTRMAPRFLTGFLNRFGGARVPAILLALALLGMVAPASAQGWTVDAAHSQLTFTATQDKESFRGSFRNFRVNIDFDPQHPAAGKIVATIDIASMTAGSAERDAYLPQSDWFDTKNFPQATFTVRKISPIATKKPLAACSNGTPYAAEALLALKGVTKTLPMFFCLTPEGDQVRATGHVVVTRTDFNVGVGQWSDDAFIRHAVDVAFDIVAKPNR